MESHRSDTVIRLVAIGQFIPFFLYPIESFQSLSPVLLGLGLAVFAFIGYYVWTRRPWAKTLTIFIQGFNIIARIMLFLANATEPLKKGGTVHWSFIVTCLAAIVLSAVILVKFDAPEIEVAFTG